MKPSPSLPVTNLPFLLCYRLEGSIPTATLENLEAKRDERLAKLTERREMLEDKTELLALAKQRIKILADHEETIVRKLDRYKRGNFHLQQPAVRELVIKSWRNLHDRGLVELIAVCVMRNYVCVLLQSPEDEKCLPIAALMDAHRTITTRKANQHLARNEEFLWAESLHQRKVYRKKVVAELEALLDRPVAAGLATTWADWPGNYLNPEYAVLVGEKAAA